MKETCLKEERELFLRDKDLVLYGCHQLCCSEEMGEEDFAYLGLAGFTHRICYAFTSASLRLKSSSQESLSSTFGFIGRWCKWYVTGVSSRLILSSNSGMGTLERRTFYESKSSLLEVECTALSY